mgnify:CR=1 FL=1
MLIAGVGEQLGTGLARVFAGVASADDTGGERDDSEGDAVALVARSAEYVERLADEISAAGGEACAVTADVTDRAETVAAVEQVEAELGSVDVAIHNASAGGGSLDDAESFTTPVRTRIEGGGNLAAAVVPGMRERGHGTLLFAGTTFAHDGSERLPGWGAAAFGTRGLARSLARRCAPDGVHVCYVAIGGTIPPADAQFQPAGAMDPRRVASSFVHLADQPETAWSHEVDLRPSGQPP